MVVFPFHSWEIPQIYWNIVEKLCKFIRFYLHCKYSQRFAKINILITICLHWSTIILLIWLKQAYLWFWFLSCQTYNLMLQTYVFFDFAYCSNFCPLILVFDQSCSKYCSCWYIFIWISHAHKSKFLISKLHKYCAPRAQTWVHKLWDSTHKLQALLTHSMYKMMA